jgi:TrmH family RNA methyltransferase
LIERMGRVTTITSRDNPLLVRLRKTLAQPDGYRKTGLVWIEGRALCEAWLAHAKAAPAQALVGATAWAGAPALAVLARRAESVAVLSDAAMRELATLDSSDGIAFAIAWSGSATAMPHAASIVLDRLQDAGNVGTLLRSAAAFGFSQAIALKGTAALWSPKVLRAGMGAHFALNLVEGVEPSALDALAVPLFATSSHAAEPVDRAELPWPCGWVLGHEGQGLAQDVASRCAAALRIRQPGGEESLNVAVAGAVCMYESARRRF